MSFFVNSVETVKKNLTPQSHLVVAVDTSGSTRGNVLQREIELAKKFTSRFENHTLITWNSAARCVKNFEDVVSGGGTNPVKFVEYMLREKINADLLVLITDGQISSIDEFRSKVKQLKLTCPIIVALTVPKRNDEAEMVMPNYRDVNMSIVEACLTCSSNVAVLLHNDKVETVRFFQGTGYFQKFLDKEESSKNVNERFVSKMSIFDAELVFPYEQAVVAKDTDMVIDNDNDDDSFVDSPSTLSTIVSTIGSVFGKIWSNESNNVAVSSAESANEANNSAVSKEFSILFEQLPSNVVQTSDGRFLLLDKLATYCATVTCLNADEQKTLAFALNEAANRTALPKLDVETMRASLHTLQKMLAKPNPKLSVLKLQIYDLQSKLLMADIAERENIRKELQKLRQELSECVKETTTFQILPELKTAVENLSSVIGQYVENKAAYEYSSNRATNAHTIEQSELQDVGKCVQGECPITLTTESLVVYFQIPEQVFSRLEKLNKDKPFERPTSNQPLTYEQRRAISLYFTRNQMIDNYALCGVAMMNCITPGLYGIAFAQSENVVSNPITRVPIIGFVPLSYDIRTMIRFLCNVFCGGKEMPFILPAYVSMVAQHLAEHQWAHPLLREHAKYILNRLLVNCRYTRDAYVAACVAAGQTQSDAILAANSRHTTLADTIVFKLQHANVIRLLSHGEVRAMIDIAEQLMPERKIDLNAAKGAAYFCNSLRMVRDKYFELAKKKRNLQEILLECFNSDGTVRRKLWGYIAWFFAVTQQKHGDKLRLMRFQQTIDCLLEDKEYGPYFLAVYSGQKESTLSATQFPHPVDEPCESNVHFNVSKSFELYKYLLQPAEMQTKVCCAYCDKKFETRAQVALHAKEEMGSHFIEFTRILIHKPELFVGQDDQIVEQNIMHYLQKRCGALYMAIYTLRTRKEIRAMIQAWKEYRAVPKCLQDRWNQEAKNVPAQPLKTVPYDAGDKRFQYNDDFPPYDAVLDATCVYE